MFTVPGRATPVPYAGCVEGPVTLQFSAEVTLTLPFIRLVNHGRPLCIIGADALSDGAATGAFGFVGMGPCKLKGAELSQGWACFCKGTEKFQVPLVNAPVRGLRFTRPADDVAAVLSTVEVTRGDTGVSKLLAEHQLEQMRPGMQAAFGDELVPASKLEEPLGELAGSQRDTPAKESLMTRLANLKLGAQVRPRCL